MKKAILFSFFAVIACVTISSCKNSFIRQGTVLKEENYTIVLPESYDFISIEFKKWYVNYIKYDELVDTETDSIFTFHINSDCEYTLSKDYFWIEDLPFYIKGTERKLYIGSDYLFQIKFILNGKEYETYMSHSLSSSVNDITIFDDTDVRRIKNYLLTNTEPMYIIVTDEDNKEHKIIVPCIPPKKKPYKE